MGIDDFALGFAQVAEAINEAMLRIGRSIVETFENVLAWIFPPTLGPWEEAPGMLLEELLDRPALDRMIKAMAS